MLGHELYFEHRNVTDLSQAGLFRDQPMNYSIFEDQDQLLRDYTLEKSAAERYLQRPRTYVSVAEDNDDISDVDKSSVFSSKIQIPNSPNHDFDLTSNISQIQHQPIEIQNSSENVQNNDD